MKGYANPHLLVSARELAGIVSGPESARPLILDLRPPDAYTQGHVPGAVHLDLWGVSLIDTDPAPLNAFMWMIEHVLAGHGVDRGRGVVVYDEHSGMRAARAFWFLEYFGHPNVRVLDGGFGSWTREGLPVTRDADPAPKSEWTGQRVAHTIATWKDVKAALGSETVILDTRSDDEYLWHGRAGEAWRRRPRGGAHRVDAEPDARRRVQTSGGASRDVRGRGRHA